MTARAAYTPGRMDVTASCCVCGTAVPHGSRWAEDGRYLQCPACAHVCAHRPAGRLEVGDLEVPFGAHAAWQAVCQRCRPEGDLRLTRGRRWWYTFKAAVCLLIMLDAADGHGDENWPTVDVAYLAGGEYAPPGEPTVYWADVLRVGVGVRGGWFYEVGYVST